VSGDPPITSINAMIEADGVTKSDRTRDFRS